MTAPRLFSAPITVTIFTIYQNYNIYIHTQIHADAVYSYHTPIFSYVIDTHHSHKPTHKLPFTLSLVFDVFAIGVEQPFVFNNPSPARGPFTADEQTLATRTQSYWVSLAKYANPNTGAAAGSPVWPAASANGTQQLVLDLTVSTATGYRASQCAFWAGSMNISN